jgi:hypothetical protein
MPAKRKIKKSQSHKVDKIRGPARHNYQERNGGHAVDRAINPFVTSISLTCAFIPQVRHMTGIPETNLRRWQHMIADDPKLPPWHAHHGEHRRIFTQFEEISTVSVILDNFISHELIFTHSNFREAVVIAFFHKYDQSEDQPTPFQWLAGFINSFKSRHGFTSYKIHYKRRAAMSEQQQLDWIRKSQEIFQTVPLLRIVHYEEIVWLLCPKGVLTWTECGSESIQAKIHGDEKTARQSMPLSLPSEQRSHSPGLPPRKWASSSNYRSKTSRIIDEPAR